MLHTTRYPVSTSTCNPHDRATSHEVVLVQTNSRQSTGPRDHTKNRFITTKFNFEQRTLELERQLTAGAWGNIFTRRIGSGPEGFASVRIAYYLLGGTGDPISEPHDGLRPEKRKGHKEKQKVFKVRSKSPYT